MQNKDLDVFARLAYLEQLVLRDVPHPVEPIVEKVVQMNRQVAVPEIVQVPVPHEVIVERRIPVPVERIVPVEKVVQVPVPQYQMVPVQIPVPVEHSETYFVEQIGAKGVHSAAPVPDPEEPTVEEKVGRDVPVPLATACWSGNAEVDAPGEKRRRWMPVALPCVSIASRCMELIGCMGGSYAVDGVLLVLALDERWRSRPMHYDDTLGWMALVPGVQF